MVLLLKLNKAESKYKWLATIKTTKKTYLLRRYCLVQNQLIKFHFFEFLSKLYFILACFLVKSNIGKVLPISSNLLKIKKSFQNINH